MAVVRFKVDAKVTLSCHNLPNLGFILFSCNCSPEDALEDAAEPTVNNMIWYFKPVHAGHCTIARVVFVHHGLVHTHKNANLKFQYALHSVLPVST